jgi:hypothetical protein
MEKFIKFTEKKITTRIIKEDETIIETWESNPSENDPKKEFLTHNNISYYLTSRKNKPSK